MKFHKNSSRLEVRSEKVTVKCKRENQQSRSHKNKYEKSFTLSTF